MTPRFRSKHSLAGVALAALALGGCAGGGGGGGITQPSPAPAPAPAPTPTPVPTPTPTPPATGNNNTAEYQASVGPVSMNALVAYNSGATGATVRVGIIDSGIDLQSAEFDNRISSASADTAGNASIDDEDGHGTAVAFTAAGRRNGAGTHGVAFGAELIVLRTDAPGSCATEAPGDPESGCSHSDSAIARALDIATTNGARVVNISLGGSSPNSTLRNAMARATAAGVILVISAGNDGDANPDPFTAPASDPSIGRGLIIIAGSVNSADQISSFSNRAGSGANFFLAAVGEGVRAPDNENVPFIWSGTSFSAPQISGAVALLAQAFPNLTGAQIVSLLYSSARDAGAAGIDSTYGRGVLDLTRAFQPVGQLQVAGTSALASDRVNAVLSAPMGDARGGALGAIVLDGFDRAYALDLAQTLRHTAPEGRLAAALTGERQGFAARIEQTIVALSIVPGRSGIAIERMALRSDDATRARTLAASVVTRLGARTGFAIGAAESGGTLSGRLAGHEDPAFLVARDPGSGAGFDQAITGAVALRRSFDGWGLTVAAERGAVLTPRDTPFAALRWRDERSGYDWWRVGLDRSFGGLRLGIAASRLRERETLLGARFGGALGRATGSTTFVDADARWTLAEGWALGGAMRRGWTDAGLHGGLAGGGALRTSAWAVDVGKAGVVGGGDWLGLRVAQPLRVEGGGIALMLPSDYDYGADTASAGVTAWEAQRLDLTPRGRERDVELSYARALGLGSFALSGFVRLQPGNYGGAARDTGGAVRYWFRF